MQHRSAFAACHPLVSFAYFGLLFVFAMLTMQPVCLLITLLTGLSYSFCLQGREAGRYLLRIVLPVTGLTMLINPLFSHEGVTILLYLPTGNPLTLESMIYGLAAGVMLAGILLWFRCFSQIITSDKILYLFGRIIPSLSLLLSMTLRFVPHFRQQMDCVREAQAALGQNKGKLRTAISCFSATVTWALEGAVDTADSMKSRGYGTCRRTAYTTFRFERRDALMLAILLILGAVLLTGKLLDAFAWSYFPVIGGSLLSPFMPAYLALCLLPVILDRREERMWKRSVSTI